MPEVVIRGRWSRRRVLIWTTAAVGAIGLLKLAVRQAANPVPGGQLPDDAPPPALPSPTGALAVALPATSNSLRTYHDQLVTEALHRAQPQVDMAFAGKLTTQFVDVDLGDPPRDMAFAMAPLVASGAPPDVALLTGAWNIGAPQPEFASIASSRYLQPLDDFLRHDRTLTLNDFYPATLALSRHRGQLLGIPVLSVPMLLIYDRPRLRDAGVAEPLSPWSWEQLADATTRLTRKSDADGIAGEYGFHITHLVERGDASAKTGLPSGYPGQFIVRAFKEPGR